VTIDEFMTSLATLVKEERLRFLVCPFGKVRTRYGVCPIASVAGVYKNKPYMSCNYREAARALRMSVEDAEQIAHAADVPSSPLRPRVLAACGLEEK